MAEPTAAMDTDTRIEAFQQTMERVTLIPGQLQTLAITLARADELPGITAGCSCRLDAARLREEQVAIGHPLSLRIRLSQLESELWQGFSGIGDQLRAAIDAAMTRVTTAAGGQDAVRSFPFARRHLEMLAMHRTMPTTASTAGRLVFIRSAWLAIDAALASLCEIRFEASLNEAPI
ncbi:MAG: hypothetical protein ORN51_09695 [Akkermansiaceae bacterium]|nr:hypothetical protein [Akkermansiaceae bacterium]